MANIVVEHTPSNRRQSTPNVLNKSEGVVSASFQIPVSLQTDLVPNKKEHLFSNVKTSTNLYSNNRKNPDIPPSEHVRCEQEVDGRRISGSSIFGTKNDPNPQEIHNIGGKTTTFVTPNMQLPQLTPASNIVSCTSNLGMKSNEPKLSTSISNIGESILRSKTEEFERKMQHNNHSTEDKFSTNSSGKNQSQQLYKRQELIASSKRNRSHKK